MNYILVIPARYKSTRFPGKPLVKIKGKTLLQRVYEQCLKAVDSDKIFVATDDYQIQQHCISTDMKCVLTSEECLTGTDRVAEVSKKINADYYINVQGDEPVFNPKDITLLLDKIKKSKIKYDVYGGYCPLKNSKEYNSPHVPKVIFNLNNELLYMSRSPIPGNKNLFFNYGYRQVCAYGFSKKSLEIIINNKEKTPIEDEEDIELLRFLELGLKVKMIEMSDMSIPVDNPEDIQKVLNAIT